MADEPRLQYFTDYKWFWESDSGKPAWVVEVRHLGPTETPYGHSVIRVIPNRAMMAHLNALAEKGLAFVGEMLMATAVAAAGELLGKQLIPEGQVDMLNEVLIQQKEGIRHTLVEITSRREGTDCSQDTVVNLSDFLPSIADEIMNRTRSALSESQKQLLTEHQRHLKEQDNECTVRRGRREELIRTVAVTADVYKRFSLRLSHAWLKPATPESIGSAFVNKIARSLEAMAALWRKGLDEDASVLARTVLEAVIDFKFFLKEAEAGGFDKLLAGWQLERLWLTEELAKLLPEEVSAALVDPQEEKEKKELLSHFTAKEVKLLKRFGCTRKSVFERAKDVGLTTEYTVIYRHTSRNVHARDLDEQLIFREVYSDNDWEAYRLSSIEKLCDPILRLCLQVARHMDALAGTKYKDVLDGTAQQLEMCFEEESEPTQ